MQVKLNEIEKEIEKEVLMILAKNDMTEVEFLNFLFSKVFTVRHPDCDEKREWQSKFDKDGRSIADVV